jgi:predicted nucleic acid-binding protein
MIVVADTSPINYLVLIGCSDLLLRVYGRVVIPSAVAQELSNHVAPQLVRDWIHDAPEWLDIRSAPEVSESLLYLGRGEREGIALAESLHADMILIDDLPGRLEAERRGFEIRGTLGILAEAARRDLVVLKEALQKLSSTNFYASPQLIERLLKEDEQKRQNR